MKGAEYFKRPEVKLLRLLDQAATVQELSVLENGIAVIRVTLNCAQEVVIRLLCCMPWCTVNVSMQHWVRGEDARSQAYLWDG